MLTLLLQLLVGALVIWVVHYIIAMLKIPEPGKTIVYLIVAVVAIVWLLRLFGVAVPI